MQILWNKYQIIGAHVLFGIILTMETETDYFETEEPAYYETVETDYFEDRIIGGKPVSPGELPYQLQLRVKGFGFICGAVLVQRPKLNDQVALTAAHCVTPLNNTAALPKQIFQVVGGITEVNETGQMLSIRKILVHPKYTKLDNNGSVGDIAILFLNGSFNINDMIQPLALPKRGQKLTGFVTVSGWGLTSSDALAEVSPVLLKQEFPIVNTATCNQWYQEISNTTSIYPTNFCAGYKEGKRSPCSGDSGGPAMANVGGEQFLAGIVSWGATSKWQYDT